MKTFKMKMNKIFYILAMIVLIGLYGCEEYLEIEPSGSLLADQAFNNKEDIIYGINGCYDALQFSGYYGRTYINVNDLAADNAYNGGTILEYGQVNNNNILEDNALIEGIWADIYTAINRVNTILTILDDIELTEDESIELESELRFLRALHYFNLIAVFEQVPLRTQPTRDLENLDEPLADRQAVFSFIQEDLQFARGNISNTEPVKATNWAVETLRAKVFLHQQQWDSVFNITTRIINSGEFELEENYANLFVIEEGPESILEVNFSSQDKNRLAEYFFPNTLNGRYEMAPEDNLIEAYETGDERKDATIAYSGNTPYVKKYENITDGSDNVYVFRFAEIYLLRAEANARRGTGTINIKSDINKVRTRAGLGGVAGSSTEEMLDAIMKERRLELAFEGQRWIDLVRTGRADEELPNISSEEQFYFPVPLSETQTNNAIN
jgi:hypothetical protein